MCTHVLVQSTCIYVLLCGLESSCALVRGVQKHEGTEYEVQFKLESVEQKYLQPFSSTLEEGFVDVESVHIIVLSGEKDRKITLKQMACNVFSCRTSSA